MLDFMKEKILNLVLNTAVGKKAAYTEYFQKVYYYLMLKITGISNHDLCSSKLK